MAAYGKLVYALLPIIKAYIEHRLPILYIVQSKDSVILYSVWIIASFKCLYLAFTEIWIDDPCSRYYYICDVDEHLYYDV